MYQRLLVSILLTVVTSVSVAVASDDLIFKKVDFIEMHSGDERQRDVRLVLDPNRNLLTIADESQGAAKATYAIIPYNKITKIVYERTGHRRYKAALLGFANIPLSIIARKVNPLSSGLGFLSPLLLLSKEKKHWLTIEFTGIPDQPQNYAYIRLDKKNYVQILSALGAGTGHKIERIINE